MPTKSELEIEIQTKESNRMTKKIVLKVVNTV